MRYMQQQPNPYDSLFSAIGSVLGQGQRAKQDAKDTAGIVSAMQPYETNTMNNQFQYLTPQNNMGEQKIAQGLLPTGFNQSVPTSDMVGQGLLSGQQHPTTTNGQQQFFPMQQDQTQANPNQVMGKYSPVNNPAAVSSAPLDWAGTKKDIQKQGYQRLTELAKTMSPDAFRAMLPDARKYIDSHIADTKIDFDKNVETKAWTSFDSAPDYKTKMMTGIKAGLNPQLLKMALDTGIEIKTQDVGDKFISYGVDTHNNRLVDLKTGEQLDPAIFTKGISAVDQMRNDTTMRGQNITAANSAATLAARQNGTYGGRGRGGLTTTQQMAADNKLINAKAIMNAYSDSGKPYVNNMGENSFKPYSAAEQIKFNQAADYIKANDMGGSQDVEPQQQQEQSNPDGAAWYSQKYDELVASGMDADKATGYMQYLIQQNGG